MRSPTPNKRRIPVGYTELIREAASLSPTDHDVATSLGISEERLAEWIAEKPVIRTIIDQVRLKEVREVLASAKEKAAAGVISAAKIYFEQMRPNAHPSTTIDARSITFNLPQATSPEQYLALLEKTGGKLIGEVLDGD